MAISIGSFSWVTSDRAVARTVTCSAGPRRVAYSSSFSCIHLSGRPLVIGCSLSRVSTGNEKYLPWVPPPPPVPVGTCSTLPSFQRSMGPDLSLRLPQPPTPIILLYSAHLGNELSAAWTATKPPPLETNCSKAVLVAAG